MSGVTEAEELVHSSAPQIPPTMIKNEQDVVVLYVRELAQQKNSGFRCNVSEIWISRFGYL